MAVKFIASEVAQGLRRNLSMTLAMIITTAVALAMLGAGVLVVMTASASQGKYDYLNEFRVYVDRSISMEDPDCAADCATIRAELETTEGVASVEYKNPDETYEEFVELFSSTDPVLVESTSPDALGSRFTLTLSDPTQAEAVSSSLDEVRASRSYRPRVSWSEECSRSSTASGMRRSPSPSSSWSPPSSSSPT